MEDTLREKVIQCAEQITSEDIHNAIEFYKDDDFIIKEQRLFAYRVGELNGHGGEIFILGVNIPQSANTYKDFVEAMETTEKVLLNSIIKIVEREPSHEVEYLIP